MDIKCSDDFAKISSPFISIFFSVAIAISFFKTITQSSPGKLCNRSGTNEANFFGESKLDLIDANLLNLSVNGQ